MCVEFEEIREEYISQWADKAVAGDSGSQSGEMIYDKEIREGNLKFKRVWKALFLPHTDRPSVVSERANSANSMV